MNRTGSLYIEKDSIFHRLEGSIKFIMLIAWTVFIFMFMDLRIFVPMTILGFITLKMAKIPFKSIKPLVIFVIVFTIMNTIFLILITPEYGSELAGTYTKFISMGSRSLTYETMFFALTLAMKYLSILPITMLFIFTTHPSKFASSLNKVGVSYKVAYSVSIALRYIPDVKEEMKNIINAQEARGVSFNKKDAKLFKRLRNYIVILIPLVISSLNRVEVVSNAMELRGFGRNKKRTWYNRKPFDRNDFILLGISILFIVAGVYFKNNVFMKFWYPF
ncbi:energy-coupling factor transporter transmembrane component T family protein [Oceanirhabdus sp. W0125-5]|uniref:energy-coupling factor transporter transmembrane component T family protein n=1 Tax=Oceanirhabdus sp. W0125-5 TaxID=2999116 RepID=UPI0022F2B80E|nr:energy-coupling factor transporter transmembrane component T [Oceanirhabdus sp. W0125-5]WBW97744.1 energy-coupling factor transporter transmembrane component T [Oceanirhabdus sp. W0125-5]